MLFWLEMCCFCFGLVYLCASAVCPLFSQSNSWVSSLVCIVCVNRFSSPNSWFGLLSCILTLFSDSALVALVAFVLLTG